MYEQRIYRDSLKKGDLDHFLVEVKESDLWIGLSKGTDIGKLKEISTTKLTQVRKEIGEYIKTDPGFGESLTPHRVADNAPEIVRQMSESCARANVGPMAGVAGAIAEYIGRELLQYSKEVVVENGGDIFLALDRKRTVGIYTRNPKFSDKLALEVKAQDTPLGICTSSGMMGHSKSFGKADAVVAVSKSASLADACATAVGNMIQGSEDIDLALEYAQTIEGLIGIVVIKDDRMGAWGNITLVSS
ncbi:MAG: UPF0280 family protein [bacterium]